MATTYKPEREVMDTKILVDKFENHLIKSKLGQNYGGSRDHDQNLITSDGGQNISALHISGKMVRWLLMVGQMDRQTTQKQHLKMQA